jgi:chromosome transmission fidelity protein 1
MILSKEQRNSFGISLEGNIVIFDEAHNIVEAANSIHSAEITTHQLNLVTEILENYSNRYRGIFSGKNLYNIQILKGVVSSLLEKIQQLTKTETLDPNYHSLVMKTNDFLFRFGLDNINLLQLCKHAKEIHLVEKLSSSASSLQGQGQNTTEADLDRSQFPTEYSALKALRCLFQFLLCLCNRDSDGRIFFVGEPTEFIHFHIRFALINPSAHFQEIIDQTRCVLFLGGTLRPFSLISSQLFPQLLLPSSPSSTQKSLVEFSCDHIIPSSHLNATILTHGSSGCPLNFRYSSRESSTILSDLFEILCQINRTVLYGVVIFFPSYSYLDFVLRHWRSSSLGLFRQLQALKPIFLDTRTPTSELGNNSDIWRDYSTAATASPRGACLFSVIGGRLSEGINFSDNLARCVAIVGMPYPDRNDPVLQEKLRYSESINSGSGKILYDSLCMRAVNQSIGRSIRHLDDYASIVLLDIRYSQKKIIELLPNWISKCVTVTNDTRVLTHSLRDFVSRFANAYIRGCARLINLAG